MDKKYYKWIFIVIVILVLALVIYLFVTRKKVALDEIEQQLIPNQPGIEQGNLPLVVGDKNSKVQVMQKFLISMGCNIPAGPTAYFGSQTQAALKCAGYSDSKIDQADYDNILAGKKKSTTGPTSTKTKGVYSKYDNTVVRNKDLSENRKVTKDQWLGKSSGEDPTGKYWEIDGNYYVIKASSYIV